MIIHARFRSTLCIALLAACADTIEPRALPAGTILTVDGEPIAAVEVDEWVDTIRIIEHTETLPSLRRKALTNIVLPRKVAALIDPARRSAAQADAQRVHEALSQGEEPPEGFAVERLAGTFNVTGLDVWGMARLMDLDEWSPVLETVGGFCVFRVVAKPNEPWREDTTIAIDRVLVPYVDTLAPKQLIEDAYDHTTLTIIDPAWREIVPEHYLYRMQGHPK